LKKTIFKELTIIKGRIRPGRNVQLILSQNLLMFLQGSADRLPPQAEGEIISPVHVVAMKHH
jgi:hypothetical protein